MTKDRPPAVDIGDPPGLVALLSRELGPAPGRLGNTLRLTLFGLMTIAIGEMFRLPDILLFAYVGFIVFSTDAGSTTTSSVAGAGAVVASTGLIILVFMVSLSQPALRLPLMALLTFVTGFLTKGAKLGHALQILGMWTVYNLPGGDQLTQGAAEQTYVSGNTTNNTLPNILFMSPEESLLHTVLWNAFELVVAVVLLYLFNQVLGRDPARVLRSDLADRLDAAARVCDGEPDAAPKLAKLARQGTAKPLKLQAAAKTWHRSSPRHEDAETLIADIDRLGLLILAWHRVATSPPGATIAHAARTCREAARALRRNALFQEPGGPAPRSGEGGNKPPPGVAPLATELTDVLADIRRILSNEPGKKPGKPKADKASGGFLVADAWTNPDYTRFGLKLTLCAAISYGVESLTDWSGIGTCLITVFVVSFESTGETVHKALLRMTGCLVGAGLGIGTILLLMPHLTNLGDFLLAMAGPLLLAAWIKNGGERTNYIGQQIAIAYFACVISGYGPTLDMEGGRDRIVGILLGDITVYVVFTTIWPVSIASGVRKNLGQAFNSLAGLLKSPRPGEEGGDAKGSNHPDRDKLRQGFDKAIAGTQASLVNDRYETTRVRPDRRDPDRERRLIGAGAVASVQALVLPVSMLLSLEPAGDAEAAVPAAGQDAAHAYQEAMAKWFGGCAGWVQKGTGGSALLASLPTPPDLDRTGARGDAAANLTARAAWFALLHEDALAMIRAMGANTSHVRTTT